MSSKHQIYDSRVKDIRQIGRQTDNMDHLQVPPPIWAGK